LFVVSGRRLVPRLTFDHHNGARQPRIDNAMVKAITRAFRWREMLETGG
jgi:hypothetical protein